MESQGHEEEQVEPSSWDAAPEHAAGEPPADEQPVEPEQSDSDSSEQPGEEQVGGLLAGTSSEQAPGVGGSADHPAPAAVLGEDGELHVAGEPPAGTAAASSAPAGDATDLQSGDVTDPEARAKLDAVTEPEPKETTRPDLGPPDQE